MALRLSDPLSSIRSPVAPPTVPLTDGTNIFCAGHTILPDGASS